jgi:hypothetical protein
MYGNNPVRMTHSGALPHQAIRQGFPPNMTQQGPQQMLKDIRQPTPHSGFLMRFFIFILIFRRCNV